MYVLDALQNNSSSETIKHLIHVKNERSSSEGSTNSTSDRTASWESLRATWTPPPSPQSVWCLAGHRGISKDEGDYKWEMTHKTFWQTTWFPDPSPVAHTPFLWGFGPRLWWWAAAHGGSVEAEEESGKTTRKMKQAAGAPEIRGHHCCDINSSITH